MDTYRLCRFSHFNQCSVGCRACILTGMHRLSCCPVPLPRKKSWRYFPSMKCNWLNYYKKSLCSSTFQLRLKNKKWLFLSNGLGSGFSFRLYYKVSLSNWQTASRSMKDHWRTLGQARNAGRCWLYEPVGGGRDLYGSNLCDYGESEVASNV